MTSAPRFNPQDIESQAAWRQWVTDSISWMQDQLKHIHECIETRIGETKAMVAEKYAANEELSESRHQQNLDAIHKISHSVQLLSAFMENAKETDIAQQAVAEERARIARAKDRERENLRLLIWRAVEFVGAGGILALSLTGLYSIAHVLGF